MSRSFTKKALMGIGVLLSSSSMSLFSPIAAASATLIEEGAGYKKLVVPAQSLKNVRSANANSPLNIYTFDTLGGVLELDLPEWLLSEIFTEHGFDHWQDAPQSELNKIIAPIVIDIDQVNYLTQEMSSKQTKGICGGRWTNEIKSHRKDFNQLYNAHAQTEPNQLFNGQISGDFSATGEAILDVHYQLRSNRCFGSIPYRFRYQHTDLVAKASVNRSEINYSGQLDLNYRGDIINHPIELLEFEHTFWASIAKVEMITSINLNLGLEVEAGASIDFSGDFYIEGDAKLSYRCYLKKCDEQAKHIDFALGQSDTPSFGAEVDLLARPFADLNVELDTTLYWKSIDVAELQLGIVSALPARLYAYTGNSCGDANADGKREWIHGAMFDVNLENYMYFRAEALGFDYFAPINLNLSDNYYRRASSEVNETKEAKVYYTNLYFDDLISSGSGIFEPMINIPDIVAHNDAGAIISARPCYPLLADMTYEIDWGDGTIEQHTMSALGSYLKHDWPYLGNVNVRSRIVKDEAGRKINSNWTYKTVNVSADGKSPYYPWVPAVITTSIL